MKLYTFELTLTDSGLPYPNIESAKKDAEEWAKDLADSENCTVSQVKVVEDD
jgi:hypothetical protein